MFIKHLVFLRTILPGKSTFLFGKKLIFYDSIYSASNLQAMVFNFERFYYQHLRSLRQPVVIDIGACIGHFSIVVSNLFDKAMIYACEPLPKAYSLLERNCKDIKSIRLHNLGFAEKEGKRKMYFTDNYLIISSLYKRRFSWMDKTKSIDVNLDSLDNFVEEHKLKAVDILKIDTEGAEYEILLGAKETLSKTYYLILECSFDNSEKETFAKLMKCLDSDTFSFNLICVGNSLSGPQGKLLTVDLLLEIKNYFLEFTFYPSLG